MTNDRAIKLFEISQMVGKNAFQDVRIDSLIIVDCNISETAHFLHFVAYFMIDELIFFQNNKKVF